MLNRLAVRRKPGTDTKFPAHFAGNWLSVPGFAPWELLRPPPKRSTHLVELMHSTVPYHRGMPDLVFEVVQEADGGYCAECLTENSFTEGDTWEQLRENVLEATTAFFFDQLRPQRIRLHLVRDEILSVA